MSGSIPEHELLPSEGTTLLRPTRTGPEFPYILYAPAVMETLAYLDIAFAGKVQWPRLN